MSTCGSYRALTRLEGFGGGILANKQSKEVGNFYDLQKRCDTPMNVLAHNTTTLRSLAEIRHRENVPPVETQYRAPEPMNSLLPDPVTPVEIHKAIADIKDLKKPKPVPPAEFIHGIAQGKTLGGSISTPKKSWNPFARPSAETHPEASSSETACAPPSKQEPIPKPGFLLSPNKQHRPETLKPVGKSASKPETHHATESTDPAAGEQHNVFLPQGRPDQPGTEGSTEPSQSSGREAEKKRTKIGGLFRRTKTSSDEVLSLPASSVAKLSAEANKAAHDLQDLQRSIPEIKISEGPIFKEGKESAIKRYQEMLEVGVADPVVLLKAAEDLSSIQPIIELPPVRKHSLSEDTVLAPKATPERLHSLSVDALIAPAGKSVTGHSLSHDEGFAPKPSMKRAHRLSADATIPVQTAVSGHYLDADPTVNTPQQLFSHELLEDVVIERRTQPPRSHGLDSDKQFSVIQSDHQAHGLHSDKQISMAQRQPESHGLHADKILPGLANSRKHELHSDNMIISKASSRSAHDIAHNVRILSPSGQVRDPHSMGSDESVKKTTVFRKSPHPEAIPGHYAGSSSSGDANENAMTSLNASLQNAGQALGDLNRALERGDAARMSPSGQGFWGRMFGRREEQEEGQSLEGEPIDGLQGPQGAQSAATP